SISSIATGGEQSSLERFQNRAGAVAHAELCQNAGDLILNGSLRGAERIGNLAVAIASGHQTNHLSLSWGEALEGYKALNVNLIGSPEQPLGDGGLKYRGSASNRANGRNELLIGNVLEHEASGSGANSLQHSVAVVESGKDQRRWKSFLRRQFMQHVDTALVRH